MSFSLDLYLMEVNPNWMKISKQVGNIGVDIRQIIKRAYW